MFKIGKYYLSDSEGNLSGPFNSRTEAVPYAIKGDVLIQVLDMSGFCLPKNRPDKIVLDFNRKTVTITGNKDTEAILNKVKYTVGVHDIKDIITDWEVLITDSLNLCKDTKVIGNPPIEGEYLNEMLYM